MWQKPTRSRGRCEDWDRDASAAEPEGTGGGGHAPQPAHADLHPPGGDVAAADPGGLSADRVTVPVSQQTLVDAAYHRDGADLVLVDGHGDRVLVHDFFAHDALPRLTTPDGASLSGDLAASLAGQAVSVRRSPGMSTVTSRSRRMAISGISLPRPQRRQAAGDRPGRRHRRRGDGHPYRRRQGRPGQGRPGVHARPAGKPARRFGRARALRQHHLRARRKRPDAPRRADLQAGIEKRQPQRVGLEGRLRVRQRRHRRNPKAMR